MAQATFYNEDRVVSLINAYIALKESQENEINILHQFSSIEVVTTDSGSYAESSSVTVMRSPASEDPLQKAARQLISISNTFERDRKKNRKSLLAQCDADSGEEDLNEQELEVFRDLIRLGGQINIKDIAKSLSKCLNPKTMNLALGYIIENSQGNSQIALSFDLVAALYLLKAATSSFEWVKNQCASFILRNEETAEELKQISRPNSPQD